MEIILHEDEKQKNELLPQLLNRIYAICKTDPKFQLKDKIQLAENVNDDLQAKINAKKQLLEKANIMIADLEKRNTKIRETNESIKIKLLEALGSEL